ncbi:uncharacterized protein CLUP02_09261 [Colletotrichum lupini]|uniref:Uncharacterized protein n=1 Tax=Colletotrichum lupini TaxID=145971 RepID=A0A9Q8WIE9_9PEZI|nr:uncharacterized protein CLUP02_09261 [Colletotrichum lupini]UQC83765.1 hypothetical protein CLUP02_09261 [Colletotrichum lupini]
MTTGLYHKSQVKVYQGADSSVKLKPEMPATARSRPCALSFTDDTINLSAILLPIPASAPSLRPSSQRLVPATHTPSIHPSLALSSHGTMRWMLPSRPRPDSWSPGISGQSPSSSMHRSCPDCCKGLLGVSIKQPLGPGRSTIFPRIAQSVAWTVNCAPFYGFVLFCQTHQSATESVSRAMAQAMALSPVCVKLYCRITLAVSSAVSPNDLIILRGDFCWPPLHITICAASVILPANKTWHPGTALTMSEMKLQNLPAAHYSNIMLPFRGRGAEAETDTDPSLIISYGQSLDDGEGGKKLSMPCFPRDASSARESACPYRRRSSGAATAEEETVHSPERYMTSDGSGTLMPSLTPRTADHKKYVVKRWHKSTVASESSPAALDVSPRVGSIFQRPKFETVFSRKPICPPLRQTGAVISSIDRDGSRLLGDQSPTNSGGQCPTRRWASSPMIARKFPPLHMGELHLLFSNFSQMEM